MYELIRKDQRRVWRHLWSVITKQGYEGSSSTWHDLGDVGRTGSPKLTYLTGLHRSNYRILAVKNRPPNNHPLDWRPRIVRGKEFGFLGQAGVILILILSTTQS